jgi:hypothetical protein
LDDLSELLDTTENSDDEKENLFQNVATELFEDAALDTEVTQVASELANVFSSVVEMDVVTTECVLTTAKGIFEVLHSDLE